MLTILFELIIAYGFGAIILAVINSTVFGRVDKDYKKAVKPLLIFNVASLVINVWGFMEIITSFSRSFNAKMQPVSDAMDLGYTIGGKTGAQIAGELSKGLVSFNDFESAYYEVLFLGMIVLVVTSLIVIPQFIISLNSLRKNHKLSQGKMSVMYFIQSGASIVGLTMISYWIMKYDRLNNLEESLGTGYSVTLILLLCALVAACIWYYNRFYQSQLGKVYSMNMKETERSFGGIYINVGSNQKSNQTVAEPEAKPTKVCPYCGETILAVAVKCKHCGEWLNKEPEKKMVTCMVCGEQVEEGTVECPYCHEKVDGSSLHRYEPEIKMITCPICAEQIPDNVDVCPICNEKIK